MGSNMDTGKHMGTVGIEEGIQEGIEAGIEVGTEVQGIAPEEKFGLWTVA